MSRIVLAWIVVALAGLRTAAADDACSCDVTAAACDAACACDLECEVDWSVDECGLPGADCDPGATEPDDASLDAADRAAADDEVITWSAAIDAVRCPDGATRTDDGRCAPTAEATAGAEAGGGCGATRGAGLALAIAVIGLAVLARRRRALAPLVIAACTVGDTTAWDVAVDAGPTGDDNFVDVYGAQLGDRAGAQLLLKAQPLAPGAHQPEAQFALSRAITGAPVYRIATAGGDRLVTEPAGGAELVGWANPGPGDGTAPLVELRAPDGGFVYETDDDAIEGLVEAGYTTLGEIGQVWPPGWGDRVVSEDDPGPAGLAPCTVSIHAATRSPLILLYASPGSDESERFLIGCPGEVVIGEKRELGPRGRMRLPANHAAGGRTAFVLDRHGDKLRALLMRDNGVERTRQYLRAKLAAGYDYIVIDEVTAAADYRDGATFNRRLRKLMQRMPARTIIPYISIDLTQYPGGLDALKARRRLLRTFKLRARALALEVYLHTGEVMAGRAPSTFRRAANRLALAVAGLPRGGGINLRAITVPATSMHAPYAQYRYLDQPAHDLAAITRQVNAIRHGNKRLRQQHGLGYYFVNKSDMKPAPGAPYDYDDLIRRMRRQALRFKD